MMSKINSLSEIRQRLRHEWREELGEFLGCTAEEALTRYLLPYFISPLRVELTDDSSLCFRGAFFLVREEQQELAVFTEHCGYHVFPLHDAKVYHDDLLVYEQTE